MASIGILGIGTYLPPHVRTNDWWSRDTIAEWGDRVAARVTRADAAAPEALGDGARMTLQAMQQYAGDPFRGAVQRRIMPDTMTTHDMESLAIQDALARAGVRADQIDVLLTQTPVPEQQLPNTACVTHRLAGLPRHCMTLRTEAACNALAMHTAIARGMIASGQARYVLSVHSSAMTRILRPSEPDSAWWGDGAAAVVLGPVSEGRGVRSMVHNTDGSGSEAIAVGVPGKRWFDDGKTTLYCPNREHTRAMLVDLADHARDAIHDAIAAAGATREQVDFYASHQGTAWLTEVTARHAGISHANTVVTFPVFGNMNSANLPMILAIAEREGQLRDDHLVVTFAGGAGQTWSSMCLRWGR